MERGSIIDNEVEFREREYMYIMTNPEYYYKKYWYVGEGTSMSTKQIYHELTPTLNLFINPTEKQKESNVAILTSRGIEMVNKLGDRFYFTKRD